MVILTAQRWAGLVGKVGAWPIALAGIVLISVGFVWILELGKLNSVVVFGVAQVIMGTGYAMCYPATFSPEFTITEWCLPRTRVWLRCVRVISRSGSRAGQAG